MPSIRISKDDRKNLLAKLRDGHDLESAGAALGLSEGEIGIAKDKYGPEIAAAFKVGTARLRARIMDSALSNDNSAILLKLLELRGKEAESTDPITLVERIIIPMTACPRCDQLLGMAPSTSKELIHTGDNHV